ICYGFHPRCTRFTPRFQQNYPRQMDDSKNGETAQTLANGEVYGLSWDLRYAMPLPQIYYVPYVYEWFNVRRYARETHNRTVNYVGPLTPCGYSPNCDFNDPRRWQDFLPVVINDFLPPSQGYMAFYDVLRSSRRPDGTTNPHPQTIQPVWLTDMHGDD
ncbi:MAG: hypothetical protein AB4911_21270, partial [Oscillochloridaceae bacterium umkhey_bin13]